MVGFKGLTIFSYFSVALNVEFHVIFYIYYCTFVFDSRTATFSLVLSFCSVFVSSFTLWGRKIWNFI